MIQILSMALMASSLLYANPVKENPTEYKGYLAAGGGVSFLDEPGYMLSVGGANRMNSWLLIGLDYQFQLNGRSIDLDDGKFSLDQSKIGVQFIFPIVEKSSWGLYAPLGVNLGILTSYYSTLEGGEKTDYFFAPTIGLDFNYHLTKSVALSISGGWQQSIGIDTPKLEDADYSRPYVALQFRYSP